MKHTGGYRYTVLIDRPDPESDGIEYHGGDPLAAIFQLLTEIQEAMDAGHVEGFFNIIKREPITDHTEDFNTMGVILEDLNENGTTVHNVYHQDDLTGPRQKWENRNVTYEDDLKRSGIL